MKFILAGVLFFFSLTGFAQETQMPTTVDFKLIKTWFIDSRDEVQLQLESPTLRVGVIANLDFSEVSVAKTDYYFYDMNNPNGPALDQVLSESAMKLILHDAVQGRRAVVTNIFPKLQRYENGAVAIMAPSVMSPYFPHYLPTETPPSSPLSEEKYYELLLKRINVLEFRTIKQCLQLFTL